LATGGLLAWSYAADPGGKHVLVAFLAATLLLQTPAVAWRIMGASPGRVLLAAICLPLLIFEPWLAREAALNANAGGDLQGIETFLMWFIVVPVVVIAIIMCAAAILLIDPNRFDA
jgi:hypothetical protein